MNPLDFNSVDQIHVVGGSPQAIPTEHDLVWYGPVVEDRPRSGVEIEPPFAVALGIVPPAFANLDEQK